MRAALAVLLALALLAGALLAVDLGVTASAEERVAEEVSETLGAPADVDIAGWPVTVRTLVTGHVPEVTVRAVDVPAGGASIDRLDVYLVDVDLELDDVRGRGRGLPPAREARFEAEIGQESLTDLLQLPEGLLSVSVDGGVLRLDVAGLQVVEARLSASGGVVVVEPETSVIALAGLGRIPIDLSGQPGRPYVDEVEVAGDSVLLRGRLEEMTVGIR